MMVTAELGRFIVNLGELAKIPCGEGRVFQVGRSSIAVFHTRTGNVFATEPSCPHKAGPLADGVIGEHKVICPLHAFVFDLSTGEPIGNNCRRLKTYPTTLNEKGEILVGVEEVLAAR
jgi:nitrite reductase (NADH) small subunit